MVAQKEICELLDKLTLETLDLIEQDVKAKINIERSTNDGQLMMAKARYIQGQNSVGESQLPTENSSEFQALSKVDHSTEENNLNIPQMEKVTNQVDKENGFIDPVKWFGVLVPQSLHAAAEKFKKAIDFTVEAANIQLRLRYTLHTMKTLNELKVKTED